MAKRTAAVTAAARKSAKKAAKQNKDRFDADDDFILDDEDEQQRKVEEDEDEEEKQETAEEKRLRLAKTYLSQVAAQISDDEDEDLAARRVSARRGVTGGIDDEEEEGGDGDRIAERLKQDAAEAMGRVQRRMAHTVSLPTFDPALHGTPAAATAAAGSTCKRAHRLAATGVALTSDERTLFSVGKDGAVFKWDVETMQKTRLYRPGERGAAAADAGAAAAASAADASTSSGPEWVKRGPRAGSRIALYAAAVSSDGAYLVVGGGDKKVHVFDARSGAFIQSYPGHRDIITGLAFREGTHNLFTASHDRTVKLWSLDDRAYMDTLFGHQAEVLSLDVGRAERVLSAGNDHTSRVWKIPEESQLIFKHAGAGASMSLDCVRYVTGTEWLSGASDGSLQLWSQMKKRPVSVLHGAHGPRAAAAGYGAAPGTSAGCVMVEDLMRAPDASGPISRAPDVTGWVQSVAVCRGSDLAASGAGDGSVRLWQVAPSKQGGAGGLSYLGALPARGFVNGLALARSGRFLAAAVGQEPRLGRWLKDGSARNGVLLHRLGGADMEAGDE